MPFDGSEIEAPIIELFSEGGAKDIKVGKLDFTAKKLLKAYKLIDDGWVQREWQYFDKYCLIGALQKSFNFILKRMDCEHIELKYEDYRHLVVVEDLINFNDDNSTIKDDILNLIYITINDPCRRKWFFSSRKGFLNCMEDLHSNLCAASVIRNIVIQLYGENKSGVE